MESWDFGRAFFLSCTCKIEVLLDFKYRIEFISMQRHGWLLNHTLCISLPSFSMILRKFFVDCYKQTFSVDSVNEWISDDSIQTYLKRSTFQSSFNITLIFSWENFGRSFNFHLIYKFEHYLISKKYQDQGSAQSKKVSSEYWIRSFDGAWHLKKQISASSK